MDVKIDMKGNSHTMVKERVNPDEDKLLDYMRGRLNHMIGEHETAGLVSVEAMIDTVYCLERLRQMTQRYEKRKI